MRWNNFGETTTEEGHKVFFSRKEDKHEHAQKDMVNSHGMSPSLQQAPHHLPEGSPFQHHSICIQAHVPTSDYDDNKTEEFYDQLQNVIDQTLKKDILVVQGD